MCNMFKCVARTGVRPIFSSEEQETITLIIKTFSFFLLPTSIYRIKTEMLL